MCLIVFAWDTHPKYKLILAANRDEFYHRATAAPRFWEGHPQILGGRDLEAGGSWMTISKKGKIAAVTNYRDPANIKPDAISRGELPTNFLLGDLSSADYLNVVHQNAGQYNGFNLLAGDFNELHHYSNYERKLNPISRGVYGLSNALLDTPWPKVIRAKKQFREIITADFDHRDLLKMMADDQIAPDEKLPDTGMPKDMERQLSAMCIRMEGYGTCCSTVITIDRDGMVAFTERSYPVGDRKDEEVSFDFKIEG